MLDFGGMDMNCVLGKSHTLDSVRLAITFTQVNTHYVSY
jgi:hypothetical protein